MAIKHNDTSVQDSSAKTTPSQHDNPTPRDILLKNRVAKAHEASIAYDALMRSSHMIVATDHPCHKELSRSLEIAAKRLGLNPDEVNLTIYQSYPAGTLEEAREENCSSTFLLPDAHVNPISVCVYLNVNLLQALNYDRGLVNAVIYHELAHLVLKRGVEQTTENIFEDPLQHHLKSYEVEYHCDRIAAIISSSQGENPSNIGRALKMLGDFVVKTLGEPVLDRHEPELSIPIFASHPNTLRRLRANDMISRNLPKLKEAWANSSQLPNIDVSKLAVTRPIGDLTKSENSFKNSPPTKLSAKLPKPIKGQIPHKSGDYELLQRYHNEKKSNITPVFVDELFRGGCTPDRISDWCYEAAVCIEEWREQFVPEFMEMLSSLKISEVKTILENINPSRLIPNDIDPTGQLGDLSRNEGLFVTISILVNRYISLRLLDNPRPIDLFSDLADLAKSNKLKFGTSLLYAAQELPELGLQILNEGTEEERIKLASLLDQDIALDLRLTDFYENYGKEFALAIESHRETHGIYSRYKSQHLTIERSLLKHTGCIMITHLGEQPHGTPPVVARRVEGSAFEIKTLRRHNKEILIIEIGDREPTEHELDQLRETINRYEHDGLDKLEKEKGLNFTEAKNEVGQISSSIVTELLKIIPRILELTPVSKEDSARFFTEKLPDLFLSMRENSTKRALSEARSSNRPGVRDVLYRGSVYRKERADGVDAAIEDFILSGRELYEESGYIQTEATNFECFQRDLLWSELFEESYNKIPNGTDKAHRLLTSYPTKCLRRDQLLCEALDLPPLNYLNDMAEIQKAVASSTDVEALIMLRDGLSNTALAQTMEVRLFELVNADPSNLFSSPIISKFRATAAKDLPRILHDEVNRDEELAAILAAFSKPSRERDRHLRPLLERANSISQKEAVASLLTDPVATQISSDLKFESRASADSVFEFLSCLSAYDKAQILLYFMGQREFTSPIKLALADDRSALNEISKLETDLPLLDSSLPAPTVDDTEKLIPKSFSLPDALVRAQKIFGISIDTAEQLQGGLLDKRTLIDLLHESLFGKDGVTINKEISNQFFKAVGETLVSKSPQLTSLTSEARENLALFVSFTFENCPQARLPNLILRVWEAFKSESNETPQVVASILQGLGPAFVKFGQKLATLDLPDDYKAAFRALSSQNQESDSSLFYHITEALSRGKIFDEESSGRKIAEGSMAATYLATMKDSGQTCVSKIIHPFIEEEIEQDIRFITKLINYINEKKPFGSLTIPDNTGEMLRKQLSEQIDTKRETEMSKELAKALKSKSGVVNFVVPQVDETYSPRGMIITQLMPGYELDKPEIDQQGLNSQKIRNAVGLEVLRLLLVEKVYQSDVNLGNFGVLKEENGSKINTDNGVPTVVWYDAGAVQKISIEDQKLLLSIVKAALKKPGEIPELLSKMVKNGDTNAEKIKNVCASFADSISSTNSPSLDKIETYFNQFFDLLAKEGLQVEEKWLEIGNTLSMAAPLLKGVEQEEVKSLVIEALNHHKMLSATERIGLFTTSFLSPKKNR